MIELNNNIIRFIFTVLFFTAQIFHAKAQSISINQKELDEKLRDLQLLNKIDEKLSLTNRPFYFDQKFTYDSLLQLIDSSYSYQTTKYTKGKSIFQILPFSYAFKYNSDHPYGWNSSNFIDAKGLQNYLTSGFFFKSGALTAQFYPEWVSATNPPFPTTIGYGANTKPNYNRPFLGQSFIKLNIGKISLGISNENMWWGPGIQNSLLMSNNAPGFGHITLHTNKPIKTPIGNIEFNLIVGKLVEDTSLLLQVKNLTTFYYAQGSYSGEPSLSIYDKGDWRYLNAFHGTFNPKWISGLFFGFTRVGYAYNTYIGHRNNFIYDYLPVFAGFFRGTSNYYTLNGENTRTKQLISIDARYLFKESHAEIYGEYGTNDNTYNLRDFVLSTNHGSIFTIGAKKIIPFKKSYYFDLQTETTVLSGPVDQMVRSTGTTYLYQGSYTQQGRILGAGFGNNSNMQTFNISLKRGFEKYGITFQRLLHDAQKEPNASSNRRWIDLSIGYLFQKRYNNFLVHFSFQGINSSNYGWEFNNNRFNFLALGGFTYFLEKNTKK